MNSHPNVNVAKLQKKIPKTSLYYSSLTDLSTPFYSGRGDVGGGTLNVIKNKPPTLRANDVQGELK